MTKPTLPVLKAAVRAACQVQIDGYRAARVTSIPLPEHCRYPMCTCWQLPTQIAAAFDAAAKAAKAVEDPALDATDRASLPKLMRQAADQIEEETGPAPETMGA